MTVYYPENLSSMLDSLRAFLADHLPRGWSVVYGYQSARGGAVMQPPRPFCRFNLLTPPVSPGWFHRNQVSGYAIAVETLQDATQYEVTVSGQSASFTSGLGATSEQVIDGLISALSGIGVSAEKAGIPSGPIDWLALVSGVALENLETSSNLRCGKALSSIQDAVGSVSISLHGRPEPSASVPAAPEYEAVQAYGELLGAFKTPAHLEGLSRSGWSLVSIEGERMPSQAVGTAWEVAAGFDLRLRVRARKLRFVDILETVSEGTSYSGSVS